MRKSLIIPLLLCALQSTGQSWKKAYVTAAGDTIVPNKTTIRINESSAITYIYPNYYDGSKGGVKGPQLEKKKRYLLSHMAGNTFTVTRLSRIKVDDDKYMAIAAIEGNSSSEYIIEIEQALKNNEIALVK